MSSVPPISRSVITWTTRMRSGTALTVFAAEQHPPARGACSAQAHTFPLTRSGRHHHASREAVRVFHWIAQLRIVLPRTVSLNYANVRQAGERFRLSCGLDGAWVQSRNIGGNPRPFDTLRYRYDAAS